MLGYLCVSTSLHAKTPQHYMITNFVQFNHRTRFTENPLTFIIMITKPPIFRKKVKLWQSTLKWNYSRDARTTCCVVTERRFTDVCLTRNVVEVAQVTLAGSACVLYSLFTGSEDKQRLTNPQPRRLTGTWTLHSVAESASRPTRVDSHRTKTTLIFSWYLPLVRRTQTFHLLIVSVDAFVVWMNL